MARYFLEFVNLQKSTVDPIIVTLKLFHNSLPKTTANVEKMFQENDLKLNYRKSQVTRVIAPEYLIQLGLPSRRRLKSVDLIDSEEFKNLDITFEKKLRGRTGLVCIAEKPGNPTIELCIIFVPWGKYAELEGYVVVGECKEWKQLANWMSKVDVSMVGDSWEIPTGDGIWVNRCGLLKEVKGSEDSNDTHTVSKEVKKRTQVNKVPAKNSLFKKRKRI